VKCPCLYSETSPICRAEADAMRIPSAEQLASHCLTVRYCGCEFYRRFLASLSEQPDRWRSRRRNMKWTQNRHFP